MRASDAARSAFAIGWARSTARRPLPLTERARVACIAAMRTAEASPQPDLTPTLQLGQLEGIWAVVYDRREQLEKLHGKNFTPMLDAIKRINWGQVVDRIERLAGDNPGDLANALISRVEQAIKSDLTPEERGAWRQTLRDAIVDAQAEGQTVGLALVGSAEDIQIDWDLKFQAAKDALASGQSGWDTASDWIEQQTHGLGTQIGQKLASLWDAGAKPDEMEDAISKILGGSNNAGLLLDQAIGTALSAGAIDTYSQAGVDMVDFVTAGDGRVCPVCSEAEDDNSYPLNDAPLAPLHVSCRCCMSPAATYNPTGPALTLLDQYADESLRARSAPVAEAATATHEGVAVMVMVSADDAAALAVDGGETPEQLHVTLGYLAQPAADYDAKFQADLIAALDQRISLRSLTAKAFGVAVFNPNDPDRDPCAVILVQSEALAQLHDQVEQILGEDAATTFPIWFPHIAIQYGADTTVIPTDPIGSDLTLDRLVLGWGGTQIPIGA